MQINKQKNPGNKKGYKAAAPAKSRMPSAGEKSFFTGGLFFNVVFGVFVLAICMIRMRWLVMPLDRDEAEYAYMGKLVLNGVAPYKEAYNMKLPGIYYMYALIMAVFGQSSKAIHTGLLFLNAGTMIFLFFALRKIFNPIVGLLSSGFYGLMAMTVYVVGFSAQATHFAVFFLAVSLFFFSKYGEKKALLYAALTGAMIGAAFLMKQQAVYFILFVGISFVSLEILSKPLSIVNSIKRIAVFAASVFIPYVLVLLNVWIGGTFEKFWFWTVVYARKYTSNISFEQGKEFFSQHFGRIFDEHQWIFISAIVGVALLFFRKFSAFQRVFALLFLIFAFLATTPGFYFRDHYFVVLLPAVALLAAIGLSEVSKFISEKIKMPAIYIVLPLLFSVVLFFHILSATKEYYATARPKKLHKEIFNTNPFTEAIEVADYIKQNSGPQDEVAVLGSEPEIPFYADRKSATGYLYTYGLVEKQEYNLKMQEEMISEIEKSRPLFLVFCNVYFSWSTQKDVPMKIFDWYNKYSADNYVVVGLVDIPPNGESAYYWNADSNRKPQYDNYIWILKRKTQV